MERGARMKNIYPDETYEGRNVLSQYDRLASPGGGYFLSSFIKRISESVVFRAFVFTRLIRFVHRAQKSSTRCDHRGEPASRADDSSSRGIDQRFDLCM